MSELDKLRPEVREAVQELDGKAYPGSRTHERWQIIRTELLRLADENKRMRGIIETLDIEGHRRAEKAEAELAALKARIAESPVYEIPLSKPKSEDGWARVIESVRNERSVRGKRVRLLVDEPPAEQGEG